MQVIIYLRIGCFFSLKGTAYSCAFCSVEKQAPFLT